MDSKGIVEVEFLNLICQKGLKFVLIFIFHVLCFEYIEIEIFIFHMLCFEYIEIGIQYNTV